MRSGINYQKVSLLGVVGIFLGVVVLVRLRLLGVPLERDEGEYAYMAQQLLQGVLPYTEAQSLKFPGIFFAYTGILAIFGQSPIAIHLSLLFINLATAFLLFLLGRNLLGQSAGIFAGVSFCVLTLSPSLQGVWANSEHFVLLPAVGGVLLLRIAQDKPARFFFAGLLLGCALLIKQHAIFFCLFGVIVLGSRLVGKSDPIKKPFLHAGLFAVGGLAPVLSVALLYGLTGNFSSFWFSTVQYASEYVAMTSPMRGFENFKYNFAPILESNFTILWLSLLGLASAAWRRGVGREYLFLYGFFACSFLAVIPGFYFRPHYFLLWMPACSLLAGAGFASLVSRLSPFRRVIPAGILVLVLGLPVLIQKQFFFSLPVPEATRSVYGSNPFSASLEVAQYIREHSQEGDTIAVLGSEPQILFYAQRRSATRHLYMYPLLEKHAYARQMEAEMIREIEGARPKFVVVVKLSDSRMSSRTDLSPRLKYWARGYLNSEYEISGVVDIFSDREAVYKWGEQARGYSPRSRYHLLIHKRRT
ncbi:MAG: glycosyltransferase family 39 protein [Nitrospinae bacterium]|nr:glycosyltransferase family 39 protein [Nitrospinota bacterium]